MAHRDFAAARRERTREPITFVLREGEREFTCIPSMPGWLLGELVTSDNDMEAVQRFFREALVDSDVDRFVASVARRHGDVVELEDLHGIAEWIVEQYTGRPTEQQSDSQPTPSTAGTASKVVSFSRGTVQVAS